jgi:ribose-phosphate pyrophosphokinase
MVVVVANLLHIAGVDHVVTVDLHASQMQGFFTKPVDNLYAEPLLARWIRYNIPDWRTCVVVSKNPGGTKRVTQLADVLKLNFALITTDRRRHQNDGWMSSRLQSHHPSPTESVNGLEIDEDREVKAVNGVATAAEKCVKINGNNGTTALDATLSPLMASTGYQKFPDNNHQPPHPQDGFDDEYTDDQAHSVTYGRLVQGHIVDDDYPSPSPSHTATTDLDPMLASIQSLHSLRPTEDALGGTIDAHNSDDEDEADAVAGTERMITLVGDVRGKIVLLLDDMIDRSATWIAAAEHCKKRAGAKKVICLATHGVFGGDCLKEMDACECIDQVVVTNSFPIDSVKIPGGKMTGFAPSGAGICGKLTVIDLSILLGEAIRRNHNGWLF